MMNGPICRQKFQDVTKMSEDVLGPPRVVLAGELVAVREALRRPRFWVVPAAIRAEISTVVRGVCCCCCWGGTGCCCCCWGGTGGWWQVGRHGRLEGRTSVSRPGRGVAGLVLVGGRAAEGGSVTTGCGARPRRNARRLWCTILRFPRAGKRHRAGMRDRCVPVRARVTRSFRRAGQVGAVIVEHGRVCRAWSCRARTRGRHRRASEPQEAAASPAGSESALPASASSSCGRSDDDVAGVIGSYAQRGLRA